MPNKESSGLLEDLCLESVKDSLLYKQPEKYLRNLGETAMRGLWDFSSSAFEDVKKF